ncbi:DUF1690-domain-containing protein [Xylariaceae sp. FL0662B]|nr:DUF1690-domain-containing protein [Xylariaceae sp. FL0662B]
MGSSSSKPAADESSHVWKASSPVGVSHDVVESLQSSSETDTSRAQTVELAVQARVAAELKKLQERESEALRAAQEKASQLVEGQDPDEQQVGLSRPVVSQEVEALRARLDKRKQPREIPETVEQARGDVVRCLTENDRRPLDCWREVEAFKEEVRRLEKGWVEKVVR